MLLFAVSRWPGVLPSNFSAAYALAFCAGVYFPGRLAWWLPISTLLVSDIVMNVGHYDSAPISKYMMVNYALYALLILLGRRFSSRSSWIMLVGGGILSALVFYFVTNTAAWLQNPVYMKTLSGWLQALTFGEPGYPPTFTFFWNSLLSGGLFTGLFAGAMKLESAFEKQEAVDPEEEHPEAEQPAAE